MVTFKNLYIIQIVFESPRCTNSLPLNESEDEAEDFVFRRSFASNSGYIIMNYHHLIEVLVVESHLRHQTD